MDHFVALVQVLSVIWWRIEHPNEEKTLERKCFYAAQGLGALYQGYKLFIQ